MPRRLIFGIASAAVLAAGCASSTHHSGTPAGGGGSASVTLSVQGGHLVSSDGKSVYTLSSDAMNKSICSAGCLGEWPLVPGSAKAGSGLTASELGSFTRSDGKSQATLNGHPLYEFAGDSAGTTKGNGITDFGGTWELAATSGGTPAPAPATSSSSSSGGGGGYGY